MTNETITTNVANQATETVHLPETRGRKPSPLSVAVSQLRPGETLEGPIRQMISAYIYALRHHIPVSRRVVGDKMIIARKSE